MAASRLSDAQKEEIVAGFRQGSSATELAAAFGCSPNTVSRVVKAALSPDDYAALKQQRGKVKAVPAVSAPMAVAAAPMAVAAAPMAVAAAPVPAAEADPVDADGPGVLPIDDADDFGVEEEIEAEIGEEGGEDDDEDPGAGEDGETGVGASQPAVHAPVQCRCLSEAELPSSGYLLVDKTVELQPTPLSDCSELGPLPAGEAERQALMVYVNARQAKRHCGRSQRVIELPDVALLHRTAPYLLAQGISRVVIEGSLYSLPGA
ncbi:MAG: helix-turn-helix domain-containing protein [Cyanobacteria bacterium]|nr:helix-turn-helix domain-containing protein [Cyanobacteriota bacterium]